MLWLKPATIASIAIITVPSVANASGVLYQGDCARARIVKAEGKVANILPAERYEGVERRFKEFKPATACTKGTLRLYTLTRKSVSAENVEFAIRRVDVKYALPSGCSDLAIDNREFVGSVVFRTKLSEYDGVCYVQMTSSWEMRDANDPNSWVDRFDAYIELFDERANEIASGSSFQSFAVATMDINRSVYGNFASPVIFSKFYDP